MSTTDIPAISTVAGRITGYRDWIGSLGRMGLVTMFLVGFVVFMVAGSAVETMQATIGVAGTQIVLWTTLLFILYTWYSVLRIPVGRMRNRSADGAD